MQLKTILNRVQKHSSFVYGDVRFIDGTPIELEIDIRPRAGSRPKCSSCGRRGSTYDTLPQRRFQFVAVGSMTDLFAQVDG